MATVDSLTATEKTIVVVSLSLAFAYAAKIRAQPSHFRMILKAASTALLSLLATVSGKHWQLSTALGLGAIGDAFLAWPGETAFLCGLGSFLTAHVFYIHLFLAIGGGYEVIVSEAWRRLLATSMMGVAAVVGMVLVPRIDGSLRWPVAAYSVISLAVVLAVLTTNEQWTVAGAVLFCLSDCVLGTDEFLVEPQSTHRAWMQHAVWALYYTGQFLIVAGID
ncbi:hypothetical protein HIM_05152 [Hirsutella minnesotensis 3608]|uniref:Lysoplasmalogenase n=1 Tax=Hirsutella minnesotensis 3608 TaxID=1043627 RepID=A0A0F7ZKP0_9HYPO|nr:hypothetical protein HIM_05152 [Hirsutella minnesotensis 3608]